MRCTRASLFDAFLCDSGTLLLPIGYVLNALRLDGDRRHQRCLGFLARSLARLKHGRIKVVVRYILAKLILVPFL